MRALPATAALALGALLTPALLALPFAAAPDPGDDPALVAAARVNEMSVTRLERLLANDPTAELDRDGRLRYRDRLPTARAAAAAVVAPAAEYPYDQTFLLHSRPGAQRTVYLDFNGHTLSGTGWNQYDGLAARFYAGMSVDGSPAFSDAEQDIVQEVWRRVAEDFAPFEVDVTTQDPGSAGLTRSSSADQVYGMRALVTPENWCGPGCLGIAYFDVFDRVDSDFFHPAWAFSDEVDNDPIQIAETISHEVGHTLALDHDGQIGGSPYFPGHDMWSPIMGAGYGALTQWSKGEYSNPDNTQDDIADMAAAGIPLRTDDHGAVPTPLVGSTSGVIERASDTDVFAVAQACPGQLTVTATPVESGPNLDIALTVTNPLGDVTVQDPESGSSSTFVPTGLDATYSASVPAGTYLVAVDGVGARDKLTTGYSDYGSLGGYTVTVESPCLEPVAPGAPSAVTSTTTSSSATLRWQPPLSDGGSAVTGYAVARGGSVVELGPDARSHTFPGLAPGTTYTLSVLTHTAVGDSPSVIRSVRTAATRPGAARIGTAGSGARGGSVTATARWSAPTSTGGSTITGYQVLARRVSSSGATLSTRSFSAGRDARRLVMRLKAGRYRFEVRAVNAIGAGAWSSRSNKVTAR